MKTIQLNVAPEIGYDEASLETYLSQKFGEKYTIAKRSIDARKVPIKVNLTINILEDNEQIIDFKSNYQQVNSKEPLIIVGSGPAGLFAALKCLELGIKPIILERGKDVQARRRDLANINKLHIVNPDSNYCFGEGGAGTYSDGKLYTRSKKRGDVLKILQLLVENGANPNILYESHPHIGTNKLPKIIQTIRETIIHFGGEIYFNSRVTDFILQNKELKGVKTQEGTIFKGKSVILATGHSARDIFYLLHQKGIKIQSKPFALGIRVEHQQSLIDQIQYKIPKRGDFLPPAPYSLVAQTNYNNVQRGAFSFCMCPGGFIVPSATAEGEVVVNGMSPSRRDSKYSNSGIVVAVEPDDLNHNDGVFACLNFQKSVEQMSFNAGGKTQTAPAQLLHDFVNKKNSQSLLSTSYQPGITEAPLHELLPQHISYRLQKAFTHFGKVMKGYLTNEAQILAVESRTSSPINIPRDRETYEHISTARLFPCGEGAGYAGGIMSAAIDGEICVEKAYIKYYKN